MEVKLISGKETMDLRHRVLWQHKTFEQCTLPIDDLPTTFHAGTVFNGRIISIATFLKEHTPKLAAQNQYRLRAMATDPAYRGLNAGRRLVKFSLDKLHNEGVDLVWCDARMVALEFYQKIGFDTIDEVYDIPHIGPHKLMYKHLTT